MTYTAEFADKALTTQIATAVIPKLQRISVAKAKIAGLKDMTYTGKPLIQKIKVTLGNTVLIEGTDYEVSYTGNKNAGTATVTITGINAYKDSAAAHFKIAKAGNALKVSATSKTYKRTGLTKAKSFTIKYTGCET